MGTYVTISVAAPPSPDLDRALDAAFAEVERLEALLSEWREQSEVSRINRSAGRAAVQVSPEVFAVVRLALDVNRASDGAFDATFLPVGRLWDFRAVPPHLPDRDEIARRLTLVDSRSVILDEDKRTVELKRPGMALGLGGVAKGYIVDRVSDLLRARGFADHLVNAGGDLRASGSKWGSPWRVGVRHPGDRSLYAAIEVRSGALATSGDYERYFVLHGVRYHHILDPRTGWPARRCHSVTVWADDAATADAWATALFVIGPERGLALAREQGLEVLYFDDDYRPLATPKMARALETIGGAEPPALRPIEAPASAASAAASQPGLPGASP